MTQHLTYIKIFVRLLFPLSFTRDVLIFRSLNKNKFNNKNK